MHYPLVQHQHIPNIIQDLFPFFWKHGYRAVCILIPSLYPQRFCDKFLLICSRICLNIILSQIFDTFGNTLTDLYIIFDWCFVTLKTGVTSASFSKDWKIFWSMIWWFQIFKRCNAISLEVNFKHLEGMSLKFPFLVLSTDKVTS